MIPAAAPAGVCSKPPTPAAPIASPSSVTRTFSTNSSAEDIRGYYREKYAPNNIFYRRRRRHENRRGRRPNPRSLRQEPKPRPLPPVVLPAGTEANRAARNHRRSADRTRPLSFCLAHPRTAPSRRARSWMCWPSCSATAAARGFTRRFARNRASSIPPMPGPTAPANPGLFGMSAMVDADKFLAAREAMLAEIEQDQSSDPVTPKN